MRLGVIGTGTIATAAMRGIAGDGHQITVSRRSAANAEGLTRDFPNVSVADNQTVLDQSDVVFVALLAGDAPRILRELAFRPDQQVITLMTGISPDEVAALTAPAPVVAQMLPFMEQQSLFSAANFSWAINPYGDACYYVNSTVGNSKVAFFLCPSDGFVGNSDAINSYYASVGTTAVTPRVRSSAQSIDSATSRRHRSAPIRPRSLPG